MVKQVHQSSPSVSSEARGDTPMVVSNMFLHSLVKEFAPWVWLRRVSNLLHPDDLFSGEKTCRSLHPHNHREYTAVTALREGES